MAEASDEAHFEYATHEQRSIITNDQDFLRLANQALTSNQTFYGVFFCLSHVQGAGAIGTIVEVALFYHEAITSGAATLEDDVYNQIIYIS